MIMKTNYTFKRPEQVLVRKVSQEWTVDIFLKYEEGARHPYICAYRGGYDECLPYNKENVVKYLGTKRPYKDKLAQFSEEVEQHTLKISSIEEVLDYLNDKYTQQTVCEGIVEIPEIEEYNSAVISFWACGVFVAIDHIVYTIAEDNMHWYLENSYDINAAYIPSIIRALTRLKNYLNKDPRI